SERRETVGLKHIKTTSLSCLYYTDVFESDCIYNHRGWLYFVIFSIVLAPAKNKSDYLLETPVYLGLPNLGNKASSAVNQQERSFEKSKEILTGHTSDPDNKSGKIWSDPHSDMRFAKPEGFAI
ncbi:TPA: hypothetical protein DEP81_01945, partial [Candidatus Woesebacteria bacterium]|nr:hypothetical protein [Candidatus Woesebacteria bacterium]